MRFRAARRFGFGGASEDPERTQTGSGCNGASSNRAVNAQTGELDSLVSIFVDVRVSFGRNWVSAEDSRHAGIPGTCLSFSIKGGDSSSFTSSVRRGGQERTSGRCRGHCGHNHDTATAANDALADGKVDIALLAREILCDLYFALRANSALL
jgi:hypothetical protein